jgi:ketosteroid isomerase-like protein
VIRILCLFFIGLLAASADAEEQPSDETQILKLEDDWVRALEKQDRETLNNILAREFTFIEPDGSLVNRDDYLKDRSSNASAIDSLELADVEVRVFGDSALVTGISKITERRLGSRYRFSLRWKELWVKEAGNWKVLAGQATPVNTKWDVPFVMPR